MYVRNVAGYNFAFKYRDAVLYVPYDGRIYSIPDDSGSYRELKVIPAMHIRTQPVTYINKDGSVASKKLSGHKRHGRPPKIVDPIQPLKGVKIKRNIPEKEEPIVEENTVDNSVMNIDIDDDMLNSKKVEEPKVESPIEENVEENQSTLNKTTTKKVTKKRSSRSPRKKVK